MTHLIPDTPPLSDLLNALRDLIQQGRQRALQAVDKVQVQTYWEIGRHIIEFEQGVKLVRLMAKSCFRDWRNR